MAAEAPNSSPRMSSLGRSRARIPRKVRSTSVSASETGVRSGFDSTRRSRDRNRAIAIESAVSAS